jgi:hypothetical protein
MNLNDITDIENVENKRIIRGPLVLDAKTLKAIGFKYNKISMEYEIHSTLCRIYFKTDGPYSWYYETTLNGIITSRSLYIGRLYELYTFLRILHIPYIEANLSDKENATKTIKTVLHLSEQHNADKARIAALQSEIYAIIERRSIHKEVNITRKLLKKAVDIIFRVELNRINIQYANVLAKVKL